MSPCNASVGDKKEDLRKPREVKVWESLEATKPDFPTPVKKMEELGGMDRRVWVKIRVWRRERLSKK